MPKRDDKNKKKSKKRSGSIADAIGSEHKKARKIKVSRKDLKKNELQETSAKLVEYLTSHSNQTLYTLGAIIVIVLVVAFYSMYSSSRKDRASDLFTRARNLYDLSMNETPPSEVSLKASLEMFNSLINSFKGGSEEALAYFYEGGIYFNLKDYDNSIKMYNAFLAADIGNKTYDAIAKTNVAYSYKSKGEYDKAIDLFRDIADRSSGYVKEISLLDLGLTYEKANQKDEAVALYQDFLEKYPESSVIDKVEERINSIQAK